MKKYFNKIKRLLKRLNRITNEDENADISENVYIIYATTQNGEGRVMEVGRYPSMEEVEIIIAAFDRDVVLSIERQSK